MITLSRRQALAAGAAMLAVPTAALAANDDARLKVALDALPKEGDPAAKLDALAGLDPARLSLSPQLDLLTIRAGLAVDAEIARRFPGAKTIAAIPMPERPVYYRLLLKRRLGDVGTNDARRQLGAALVTLTARADAALRAIGRRDGSVGTRLTALMADERFLYPDSDAGRDRAVADMNRMLAARRTQVPVAFDTVPAWCLEVAVSRPARADEPAGKRILPEPGRPGGYIVDLKDIRRRPSWTLGSVVAHELVPGHLVQLPIEAAAGMHPLRADYAAAFVEGWGVYAEQLAAAEGAYDGDALRLIGHLHWLLFRAARARMDMGLHLDGWSIDRARAFLDEHQGPPAYFAPYDIELARTAAEPASRAADALAWLAIADLAPRDWRRRKQFHTRALAGGRKRLDHLRRYVITGSLA
ncbi:DUF885 family protein [Sphingomonas bacterium]|uniref:DUF885 family protein n=1 Tax=Sphingomonas bacterium TaxID=1895847 RepID=UPI0026061B0D|nr:DUF885 family protein [Sphingomonas bacterium]MDB5678861.1 hypothetical protein [Sphingomonas bacterium]